MPGPLRRYDPKTEPAEVEWAAARIGGAFVLDSTAAVCDAFEGDLIRGLILLTIIRQNLTPRTGEPDGDADGPDRGLRYPTTIYSVAKALGLNYETARRYVKRLVEDGYCERTKEGFFATADILTRPEIARVLKRLATGARQLGGHLKQADLAD